jgi:hypothetical protein
MDRRFRAACLVGALAATVVFGWVLFLGRVGLADERPAGDFYDAQARALFDGRWDLRPEVLSIEAFVVDGKTYTYFGPVPALLRMPVLAVTDRFDGRLTQVSMLGAFAVTMVGVSLLAWRVRTLVRGDDPVHRREAIITSLFVFGLGAGSIVLYLASQAVVYHEAILWGIALSLLAYHSILGWLVRPARRTLLLASVFASLAFLTRASVGLGPVAALGLAFAVVAAAAISGSADGAAPRPWVRAFVPGLERRPSGRRVAACAVAVLAPLTLYASVNLAKFDTPFRLPLEKQAFSDLDPNRQAALDDNDGSLFGLKFVPTALWQSLRPDAISFDDAPPWINFPRSPPTVIGDVTFDTLDESSSATATMPLLVVLGVVGLVAVVAVRRDSDRSALAALRLPVAGAVVGFGATLTIAFVAHRYLGDAFPLLVLLSLAGLHVCGRRFGGPPTKGSIVLGTVLLVLGAWGVATNVALAVEYQRLIAPVDAETRYDFIRFQADVGDVGAALTSLDGESVPSPTPGERGDVVIYGLEDGDFVCDALLWSDGRNWYVLENDGLDIYDVIDDDTTALVTDGALDSTDLCDELLGLR